MQKSIPELSIDTQTLERLLAATAIGDVIAYTTLSAAIGRNVQLDARGNLRTACNRLLRTQRMVFGAVTNVGLKRLNDEGKVGAAQGDTKRGRNCFKRARKKASAVDDFDALPNHVKIEHNVVMAQAGALLHMTSARATRKLEGKIAEPAVKGFKPKASLELMKSTL